MKEKPQEMQKSQEVRKENGKGKKKSSAAGSLFYTFGTILLLSVIAVCSINFAKDGRAFQIPLLSAVSAGHSASTSAGAIDSGDSYKTIKYNKTQAKTPSKSSSSKSTAGGKSGKAAATPAPKAPQPAADP